MTFNHFLAAAWTLMWIFFCIHTDITNILITAFAATYFMKQIVKEKKESEQK